MNDLADRIKALARARGFDLVGIAPATEADGFGHLQDWLARGFAGEMTYLHRQADARRHPASILANVRSVVMLGMNYFVPDESANSNAALVGKVARYARGLDYHDLLRERLNQLLVDVQAEAPGRTGRGVVDTAPLLERDFARRAGLGWIGKNTMLLNKRIGSYCFLAALLLDLELPADEPHASSHCGICTACLDACPTEAFVGPGVLDARKCISYLTIELKSQVPSELRSGLGDWLFGCDVCQEVCPWNRKTPITQVPSFGGRTDLVKLDLIELLQTSEAEFRERFRGTPLFRSKRKVLVRTAALILGNLGRLEAVPALRRVLTDPEEMIREAASWALERIFARSAEVGEEEGVSSRVL